jgi:hypothetical protein
MVSLMFKFLLLLLLLSSRSVRNVFPTQRGFVAVVFFAVAEFDWKSLLAEHDNFRFCASLYIICISERVLLRHKIYVALHIQHIVYVERHVTVRLHVTIVPKYYR